MWRDCRPLSRVICIVFPHDAHDRPDALRLLTALRDRAET